MLCGTYTTIWCDNANLYCGPYSCRVDFNDIMRAGRWHGAGDNAALITSYIGSVCVKSMLVLGGFEMDSAAFILPRACLLVPESLQKQIFPWVDEQLAKVERVSFMWA